jgi:hypothetical protein
MIGASQMHVGKLLKNREILKPQLKKLSTVLAVISICSFPAQGSSPLQIEVGGSPYYHQIPCIVKVAFKYRNEDFEPLVSGSIQPGSTHFETLIANTPSQENNILEFVSIYILQMGKNQQVDGISNKEEIKVGLNPKEIKKIKIWFDKDHTGNKRILRSKVICEQKNSIE